MAFPPSVLPISLAFRARAGEYIERYFKRFPGIRAYMEATKEQAHTPGFCRDDLRSPRSSACHQFEEPGGACLQQAAPRSTPIQGAAADIIRRAMIRMPEAIAVLPAKMLLQVHDELLFEVEEGAAEALIAKAKEVMEGAAHPARPHQGTP